MRLRLFAVEIKPDETIQVSFDVSFPPTDLNWVKEHIGKEVSLEDLETLTE